MEKINCKDACRIMEQGEFCELMQLLKDMGIVKENMRDIFPYSASYDDEDWKERVWAWILYYVVSEDALKYCGEEDEDED